LLHAGAVTLTQTPTPVYKKPSGDAGHLHTPLSFAACMMLFRKVKQRSGLQAAPLMCPIKHDNVSRIRLISVYNNSKAGFQAGRTDSICVTALLDAVPGGDAVHSFPD
jgi:hypothetical protein